MDRLLLNNKILQNNKMANSRFNPVNLVNSRLNPKSTYNNMFKCIRDMEEFIEADNNNNTRKTASEIKDFKEEYIDKNCSYGSTVATAKHMNKPEYARMRELQEQIRELYLQRDSEEYQALSNPEKEEIQQRALRRDEEWESYMSRHGGKKKRRTRRNKRKSTRRGKSRKI